MNQNNIIDFGILYRTAYAERDPERKQILLSQVQNAIRNCEQDEMATTKLGPQMAQFSKITAVA